MRENPLGRSGLSVSAVGLGCNNFGRRLDRSGTRAVIDAALDAGITLFDTADIYGGDGASERLIGEALEGRRNRVVLATKFGLELSGDSGEPRWRSSTSATSSWRSPRGARRRPTRAATSGSS